MSKIAVIYYSATGHVHKLATALARGAADAGAEVRLRRVAELAPEEVIRRQDAWQEHFEATVGVVDEAKLQDLEWADGFALGTPTRYGLPAAPLKEFIDQTGPLWVKGHLSNKVATSFTSSANRHGGQESTLLALNNTFYHWGALIVPPGYTNQVLYAAGGNPYGTSYPSGIDGEGSVSASALTAAHYQGHRLAQYAARLVAGPAGSPNGRDRMAGSAGPLGLDPYDPPDPSIFGWQWKHASP
jgi:NAD(P)H dehydrogenase (quinone)